MSIIPFKIRETTECKISFIEHWIILSTYLYYINISSDK